MDAARQVLRFSIPGSVLLLLVFGYIVAGQLIEGVPLAQISHRAAQNVGAAVAILASIPLGFVVYQLYYLSFHPFVRVGLRWGRRWPRIDRGGRVLSILSPDELDDLNRAFGIAEAEVVEAKDESVPEDRLDTDPDPLDVDPGWGGTVGSDNWLEYLGVQRLSPRYLAQFSRINPDDPLANREAYKLAADRYEKRWYRNWDALRALIDQAKSVPEGEVVKNEYTTLSDIYHALGACRTAATMAWVVSAILLALNVSWGGADPGDAAIAVLVTGLVSAFLWWVLNETRRQTWKSAQRALQYGLRYVLHRHPNLLTPWAAQGNDSRE